MALVAAAGLLLCACGGGSDKKTSSGSEPRNADQAAAGARIDVAGKEFRFDPATLTLKAGQGSTIVLKNTGSTEHDLTVTEAGFKLTAAANQTADKVLTVAKAGTYEFYCSVAGHKSAGMKGQLVVQ